jgi:N-acetylglutamate synthase-like GNAT family acetyltransferase
MNIRQALAMERFSEVSQEIEEALKQPKHEWVGLTEDEKQFFKAMGFSGIDIVEAKLKEKNR